MARYMVISSDGHAGPHAAEYRDYVDPEFREVFDIALPIQIQVTEEASEQVQALVSEFLHTDQ